MTYVNTGRALLKIGLLSLVFMSASLNAQSPTVTVWFSAPAIEVSDKLALQCANRDAMVVEQDERHVLCTRPMNGVLAAYSFGGGSGNSPQLMVRFALLKDEGATRVQIAQWVETQTSNGQVRRTDLKSRKQDESMTDQMVALGAHNYPPDPVVSN